MVGEKIFTAPSQGGEDTTFPFILPALVFILGDFVTLVTFDRIVNFLKASLALFLRIQDHARTQTSHRQIAGSTVIPQF
jgi:hypothetical protein